jgi:iron(III) transport system substrate-binding protein
MRMLNRSFCAITLLALAVLPAHTQDAVDVTKAKAEGKVSWYTSTPIEQAQKISVRFKQQTGIEVELFRSGGSAILSRFQQEMTAGRVAADVLTHSDPAAANALARKATSFCQAEELFGNGCRQRLMSFVGQRLNLMTHYYRSDRCSGRRAEDLMIHQCRTERGMMTDPRSPRCRSRVGTIEGARLGLLRKLRANDTMIVQGNQQSRHAQAQRTAIAVGALDSYAADLKREGHQVKTLYPTDGVFIIPSPTSVVKGSPHPNAAKLFAEFMIGDDAQKVFPTDGGYSVRIDIAPPAGSPDLKSLKILSVDGDYIERETQRISAGSTRFSEAALLPRFRSS